MIFEVVNREGQKVSEIDLPDSIFGEPIKTHLLYDVVRYQMAKKRSGTASTKGRSNVRGGGIKPWRQKGTGRARSGSIRSPLWVGGGTVFGPQPRDFSFKINKKVRKGALRSALALKLQNQEIVILECEDIEEAKTRLAVELLKRLGFDNDKKVLIISENGYQNLKLATRNIPNVDMLNLSGLNVYDILYHKMLVIISTALPKLQEMFLT